MLNPPAHQPTPFPALWQLAGPITIVARSILLPPLTRCSFLMRGSMLSMRDKGGWLFKEGGRGEGMGRGKRMNEGIREGRGS